jgi:hypothetical protein
VAPGTVDYGTLRASIGPSVAGSRVGVDMGVSMGTSSYGITTTGGVDNTSSSEVTLTGDGRFSSGGATVPVYESSGQIGVNYETGCPSLGSGSCRADIRGFLAGNGAPHAGLIYQFGAGDASKLVTGAAAFDQFNPTLLRR